MCNVCACVCGAAQEELLDPEHVDVGDTCEALANLWHERQQFAAARECFTRAVTIAKRNGQRDICAARCVRLARTYEREGNVTLSLSLMETASQFFEDQQHSLALATCLVAIAGLYRNKSSEAEELRTLLRIRTIFLNHQVRLLFLVVVFSFSWILAHEYDFTPACLTLRMHAHEFMPFATERPSEERNHRIARTITCRLY